MKKVVLNSTYCWTATSNQQWLCFCCSNQRVVSNCSADQWCAGWRPYPEPAFCDSCHFVNVFVSSPTRCPVVVVVRQLLELLSFLSKYPVLLSLVFLIVRVFLQAEILVVCSSHEQQKVCGALCLLQQLTILFLVQHHDMFDTKMADMTSMRGDVGLAQRQVNRCIQMLNKLSTTKLRTAMLAPALLSITSHLQSYLGQKIFRALAVFLLAPILNMWMSKPGLQWDSLQHQAICMTCKQYVPFHFPSISVKKKYVVVSRRLVIS